MKLICCAQSSPNGGASTLLTSEHLVEGEDVREGQTSDVATSVPEISYLFGYRLATRQGRFDQVLNRYSPSPKGDILGEQSVAVPAAGCITPAASVSHQRRVPPWERFDSKGWCVDPRAVIWSPDPWGASGEPDSRSNEVTNPNTKEKLCIVI